MGLNSLDFNYLDSSHMQQAYKERLDLVVPAEETDDFLHWLSFRKLKKTSVRWSMPTGFF